MAPTTLYSQLQYVCYQFSEVYNDGRGKICLWEKKVPKDEGYGCKWRTTWRMMGYKYMPPTYSLDKRGVFRFNLNSLSNGREQARAFDVNQWLETVIIIASTLGSWSNCPQDMRLANWNDSCIWNRKDWPRHMHDIMVETLKIPNNTRSTNHSMIAQKYKFKFERSWSHYSVQAFEKRPRCWGANVVCLANLASHIIICDLIRLGVMCLQEDNNTSPESIVLSAL